MDCECGASATVDYGERWTCETCGRVYDTRRVPEDEVDALYAGVRRFKLITVGPPLVGAIVLVPLAVLDDLKWGILLFILTAAWGLLVLPLVRTRTRTFVHESTSRWSLEAD